MLGLPAAAGRGDAVTDTPAITIAGVFTSPAGAGEDLIIGFGAAGWFLGRRCGTELHLVEGPITAIDVVNAAERGAIHGMH